MQYYGVTVSNGTLLRVMIPGGSAASLALFARYGALPQQYQYDASAPAGANQLSIVLSPEQRVGTWFVAVYYPPQTYDNAASYSVQASSSAACLNNCSGNGVCDSTGNCACQHEFSAEDCSFRYLTVNNSTPVVVTALPGFWVYIRVPVADANQLLFGITVTSGLAEDLVFLVQSGALPTTLDYNAISHSTLAQREIVLTGSAVVTADWVAGLYGKPGAEGPMTVSFQAIVLRRCPNRALGSGEAWLGV